MNVSPYAGACAAVEASSALPSTSWLQPARIPQALATRAPAPSSLAPRMRYFCAGAGAGVPGAAGAGVPAGGAAGAGALAGGGPDAGMIVDVRRCASIASEKDVSMKTIATAVVSLPSTVG